MLGFHKPNADERLDLFKARLKALFDADPGVQRAFLFGAKPAEQQAGHVALFIQRIIKRGETTFQMKIHALFDEVFEDAPPGQLQVTFFEVDRDRQLPRVGAPFYVRGD